MRRAITIFLKNNIYLLLCITFFVTYYMVTSRLPRSSTTLPRLLLYALVPIVIWNTIGAIWDTKKTLNEKQPKEVDKQSFYNELKKVAVLGFAFIYVFCIFRIGFFVSTSLFLAGTLYFLNIRKIRQILIYLVIINSFVYLTFVLWIGIQLPRGILI